ncbi:MAG: ABC transporter permease [Bacteroidales bacterium]|nr:ABC transporter permease [Bacteroidales bacterium]
MGILQPSYISLWRVMVREWRRILSQPIMLLCIGGVPLFAIIFFGTMLYNGLPEKIPVAIVDMDNSHTSHMFISRLNALQSVDVVMTVDNFSEGRKAMQRNEVLGMLLIPEDFEQRTFDAKQPIISFYTNDAFLIPGSLLYKSFTTMSVLASAEVVQDVMLSVGLTEHRIMSLLQPITIDSCALGNPWLNYSVYLCNSFIPTILQLMVLLVTTYAIAGELKKGSVRSWLLASRGSRSVALIGKLAVYAMLFVVVGLLLQSIMYGYMRFPFHTTPYSMIVAMVLLVMASQAVVVITIALSPTLPVAYSTVSVVGVVTFSLGGFSFPVADMYVPFRLLTNLLPMRHYFLIYVNNALNGYPVYYCRYSYVALMVFVVVAIILLPRLCSVMASYEKR